MRDSTIEDFRRPINTNKNHESGKMWVQDQNNYAIVHGWCILNRRGWSTMKSGGRVSSW